MDPWKCYGHRKGMHLVTALVFNDQRSAESSIAGYRGKPGYKTAVQCRSIRSNCVELALWVATVWCKTPVKEEVPA